MKKLPLRIGVWIERENPIDGYKLYALEDAPDELLEAVRVFLEARALDTLRTSAARVEAVDRQPVPSTGPATEPSTPKSKSGRRPALKLVEDE